MPWAVRLNLERSRCAHTSNHPKTPLRSGAVNSRTLAPWSLTSAPGWAALWRSGGPSPWDGGSAVLTLGGLMAGLLAIPGPDRHGPGTISAAGGLPVFRAKRKATTESPDRDDRGELLGRGVCAAVCCCLVCSCLKRIRKEGV